MAAEDLGLQRCPQAHRGGVTTDDGYRWIDHLAKKSIRDV
jgi:hypothetical protein